MINILISVLIINFLVMLFYTAVKDIYGYNKGIRGIFIVVLITVNIVLFVNFIYVSGYSYKLGQTDALNGKILYERITPSSSEVF